MQVVMSDSAAFLGPSLPFIPVTYGHDDFNPEDNVAYAAGTVLLPELFTNITCQAFHSGHFYQLIQKLLSTNGAGSAAQTVSAVVLGAVQGTRHTGRLRCM